MQNNSTQELIIRYAYGEASETEIKAAEAAMAKDFSLREYFESLVQLHNCMDKISEKPSQSTIEIIMEESQSHLEPSH